MWLHIRVSHTKIEFSHASESHVKSTTESLNFIFTQKKATKYAIGGKKPNNCRRQQEQLSTVQITFIAEQMTLISAQGFSGV